MKKNKERFIFLLLNLKGQVVDVTLKNGTIYEGIFHTASTEKEFNIVLKWARKKTTSLNTANPPIETFIISSKDFSFINAQEISFTSEKELDKTFVTDSNITKSKEIKEKELVPWKPLASEDILNTESDLNSTNEKWDQFEVNSKKFGVTSTYKESLYTTELDKNSDFYKKKLKIAEKIAEEIEKQSTSNVQLAIDRNQNVDNMTEEELYSSVVRKDNLKFDKLEIPVRTRSNSLRSPIFKETNIDNIKKQMLLDRNRSLTVGSPNLKMSAKINHSDPLAALDLNPLTPKVSDEIVKKFLEFQNTKKKSKQIEIKEIKEFNQKIKEKPHSINEMKSQIKKDQKETQKEKKETQKETPKESLNINAKEFNPNAKEFTPSLGKKSIEKTVEKPVDLSIPINEIYCNNFASRPRSFIDWNIPIPENLTFTNRA